MSPGRGKSEVERVVHNAEIAAMFDALADLLEIEGANRFRIRAYRKASRTISNLPKEAASMVLDGEDLSELPGIGEDLAGKIAEIINTGRLKLLDETSKRVPAGLSEIVALPGVGPKRAKLLHDMLHVGSAKELAAKIRSGAAQGIPGISEASFAKMLSAIQRSEITERRFKLADAESMAEPFRRYLSELPGVDHAVVAGSYHRRKETVGDIDILVSGDTRQAPAVMKRFAQYPEVSRVIASGETKSAVVLQSGIQVDLRFVPQKSFGAALLYFTGSKDHNIAIRSMAVDAGLKVNEYGVFRGNAIVAGKTEEEIYKLFGMDYVAPELRENRGELEAAKAHRLPCLIEIGDIRGDSIQARIVPFEWSGNNSIAKRDEAVSRTEPILFSDECNMTSPVQVLASRGKPHFPQRKNLASG